MRSLRAQRRWRLRGTQAEHASRVNGLTREVYAASHDAVAAAQACDLTTAMGKAFDAASACGNTQADARWSGDARMQHDADEACGFAAEASGHVEQALAQCRRFRAPEMAEGDRLPPAPGTLRDCTAIRDVLAATRSIRASAGALKVPRSTLYGMIQECGLRVPGAAAARGRPRVPLPVVDKSLLARVSRSMSASRAAKEFGISQRTYGRLLRHHGITVRSGIKTETW